jgi:ABC-type uncharacterized transport system ATPase subunit
MNKEYKTTVFLTSHDVGTLKALQKDHHREPCRIVLDDSMEEAKVSLSEKKMWS